MPDSVLWIIIGICGIGLLMLVTAILYFRFGWLKVFYHNLLGWHIPSEYANIEFNGCSSTSVCKYCGKEITQDSQGNWY